MKGIYLASFKAYLPKWNLDYNDILPTSDHVNILCDMLEVDLSNYDFILASPPCNFYSRANWRRYSSEYSLATKHLLPDILNKLGKLDKPFIVENVRNPNLFRKEGIYDICDNYCIYIYEYGRHTYFTNVMINLFNLPQVKDNIQYGYSSIRQGGFNVDQVFNYFLEVIHNG